MWILTTLLIYCTTFSEAAKGAISFPPPRPPVNCSQCATGEGVCGNGVASERALSLDHFPPYRLFSPGILEIEFYFTEDVSDAHFLQLEICYPNSEVLQESCFQPLERDPSESGGALSPYLPNLPTHFLLLEEDCLKSHKFKARFLLRENALGNDSAVLRWHVQSACALTRGAKFKAFQEGSALSSFVSDVDGKHCKLNKIFAEKRRNCSSSASIKNCVDVKIEKAHRYTSKVQQIDKVYECTKYITGIKKFHTKTCQSYCVEASLESSDINEWCKAANLFSAPQCVATFAKEMCLLNQEIERS